MLRRKRAGRPKLPHEEKRKFRVQIAVNLDEYRLVRRVAEAADLSVSRWGRDVILASAAKASRPR